MIRTLVVDDSALIRAMIAQVLSDDKRFQLVGEAGNGQEAIEAAKSKTPDLIIMDIHMPLMDGIQATKNISSFSSAAIIGFTTDDTMNTVYQCMNAGALDVLKKPELANMTQQALTDFLDKLYLLTTNKRKVSVKSSAGTPLEIPEHGKFSLLVIGASTGGPPAIHTVLKGLCLDSNGNEVPFPLPIVITQHIDKDFDDQFANWLNNATNMPIKLADEGEIPLPGHVYIARACTHLEIIKKGSGFILHQNDDEPLHFLKPSVDKMFYSVAEAAKQSVLAVLLTGMGRDGADGMKRISDNGGWTIAQDGESCVVFGMPKAAIDAGGVKTILPLTDIAHFIRRMVC